MVNKKIEDTDSNEEAIDASVDDSVSPSSKKIVVTEFDEPSDADETTDLSDSETIKDQEASQPMDEATTDVEEKFDQELSEEQTIGDAIDVAETHIDSQDTDEDQENSLNDDSEINELVDDIVRAESTESLKEADAKLAEATTPAKKSSIGQKLASALKKWWQIRWLRNGTIALFVLAVLAVVLIPMTRYTVLNTVGVRVNSSMTVIDSQTRLPLKNIQVQLQGKTAATDKQGQVSFEELKLGSSQLAITKRGYAENRRTITLGWGSNPIGEQEVIATGEQFTFILVDWLSNDRVTDAEASAGESDANSDEDGKIVLTIDQGAIGEDPVTIRADGYREEVIAPEDLNNADIEVKMVPGRRHAFVSNRNGQFDVYAIDLDGKNEELLLPGTQKEREVPGIVQHHSKNIFALVSSRDGIQNADKYILDGLFIINAENGESENVGRSERVQLLGWSGDSLVYTQVVEGTSRGNSERSKLYSFNNQTGEKIELASANYFNDIELVGDTVTYAVSSFAVAKSQARLYSVQVDGTNERELLDKQVYTIFRTSQTELLFNVIDQEWFVQKNDEDITEVDPVLSPVSYTYSTSPDGNKVAWSEIRDGKGILFVSDANGEKEKEIAVISGLDSVEYWANNETIVYRIIKSEETADYVLHIDAPEDQRKISDVTASKRIFF